jgi:hypothetical protein
VIVWSFTMATTFKGLCKSLKYITQMFGNKLLCTIVWFLSFVLLLFGLIYEMGLFSSGEGAGDGNWVPDGC